MYRADFRYRSVLEGFNEGKNPHSDRDVQTIRKTQSIDPGRESDRVPTPQLLVRRSLRMLGIGSTQDGQIYYLTSPNHFIRSSCIST